MPIAEAPSQGDTVRFQLATAVRPSLVSVSVYAHLEPDGTPVVSSEEPGVCDLSEDGGNVTIRVAAPDARMVTLRTAFDVPQDASATGLGEPYTASWVVRVTR